MVGGPSQMDLYDYKPKMGDMVRQGPARLGPQGPAADDHDLRPEAVSDRAVEVQVRPATAKAGMWVSELLPYTAKMVDDMCFIRSMHTDAINHEPAITFMQTGNQITGRPCLGAWVSYGLGSLNENLPTFVVLVAKPTNTEQVQAISARLWSAGYLPGEHAGVSFRTGGDPILYINNPAGRFRRRPPQHARRPEGAQRDEYRRVGDPETHTRIQQYELAFRMQSSVPELADLGDEPASTYALYGEEAQKPGTFANTVLLARRMVERGRALRPDLSQQLGHPRQRGRPPARPVPGRRPGLLRAGPGPEAARACWTKRWSSGAASSAAPSIRRAD